MYFIQKVNDANQQSTNKSNLTKSRTTLISSIFLCSIALAACNGGSSSPAPTPNRTPEVPAAEQFSANITNEITAISTTQNQTVTGVAFPAASLSNLSTKSLNTVSDVQAYMLAFESDTYIPIVWTFNGSNWESYNISNPNFEPYFTLGLENSIYATKAGLLIGGSSHESSNFAKVYLFTPTNGLTLYATPLCDAGHLTVNNGHLVTMSQSGSSSSAPATYSICVAELNNGTWTDISPTVKTPPDNPLYRSIASINNSVTISGASYEFYNASPSMLSYTTPNWTAQSTPPRTYGEILLSSTQNKFGTIYAASLTESRDINDRLILETATISKLVNSSWELVNVPFLNGLNTHGINLFSDSYGNVYATISYYPVVNQYQTIITTILVESAPQ